MSLPDNDEEVGEVDLNDIDNSDADTTDLGEKVEDINDTLDDIDDDDDETPASKDEKPERQRDPKTGKFVKDGEKEETEEEEETEETEEEEETEDTAKGKDGKKTVPLTRFQQVIKERNALRAQMTQQRPASEQRDPVVDQLSQFDTRDKEIVKELDALYESVEDLRAEGKAKDAAKVQREIDKLKDERADIRESRLALKTSAAARQQATAVSENTRYNDMVDVLRGAVPEFDGDAPEFDPDKVAEFQFDVDAYIKGGLSPTAALKRASVLFLGYDPFTGKGKPASAPAKKVTNIKRNVERANRNPPDVKGQPNAQLGKLNADDMSGEDIAKLPEKERRKLLGDDL